LEAALKSDSERYASAPYCQGEMGKAVIDDFGAGDVVRSVGVGG